MPYTQVSRTGFTLIELLVVITIIVVLLALLTPALDRAIYQAELALCASGQKSVTTGLLIYATENRRRYPHRPSRDEGGTQPHFIRNQVQARNQVPIDDRHFLEGYLSFDLLLDPLAPPVDFSYAANGPETWIITPRYLWYSWYYIGESQMRRMGDRWTYTGRTTDDMGKRHRFSLLTSDRDNPWGANNGLVFNSHPDKDGVMVPFVKHNELEPGIAGNLRITDTEWRAQNTRAVPRGLVDMQFAADDGGVFRLNDVKDVDDPRMVRLGATGGSGGWPDAYLQMPRP